MSVTICIDKGDRKAALTSNSLLAALDSAQVFNVEKLEDGRFQFQESCDGYFSANLTKEQVLDLAEELRVLVCGAEDQKP